MSTIPDELYRRILDGSPDAVLVSDREGNAAAVRTFGFSEADMLGASMDRI